MVTIVLVVVAVVMIVVELLVLLSYFVDPAVERNKKTQRLIKYILLYFNIDHRCLLQQIFVNLFALKKLYITFFFFVAHKLR